VGVAFLAPPDSNGSSTSALIFGQSTTGVVRPGRSLPGSRLVFASARLRSHGRRQLEERLNVAVIKCSFGLSHMSGPLQRGAVQSPNPRCMRAIVSESPKVNGSTLVSSPLYPDHVICHGTETTCGALIRTGRRLSKPSFRDNIKPIWAAGVGKSSRSQPYSEILASPKVG
jgi:hypothetical protein